jgi:hypothetical protein
MIFSTLPTLGLVAQAKQKGYLFVIGDGFYNDRLEYAVFFAKSLGFAGLSADTSGILPPDSGRLWVEPVYQRDLGLDRPSVAVVSTESNSTYLCCSYGQAWGNLAIDDSAATKHLEIFFSFTPERLELVPGNPYLICRFAKRRDYTIKLYALEAELEMCYCHGWNDPRKKYGKVGFIKVMAGLVPLEENTRQELCKFFVRQLKKRNK